MEHQEAGGGSTVEGIAPSLDIALAVVWMIGGIAIVVQSVQLGLVGAYGPESGFFPMLAGIAVTGGAGWTLASRSQRVATGTTLTPSADATCRVVLMMILLVALALGISWIGFLPATLLLTTLIVRTVGQGSWTQSLSVGILAPVCIYALFAWGLRTPLPTGSLSGLL